MSERTALVNSTEKITGRIISLAESDADKIISDAEKEAASIIEEYKNKATEIAASAEAETKNEVESILARAKSTSEKIERNVALDAKSAKIDETFEKARIKLLSLSDSDYEKMLALMLSSTVKKQIEIEKISLAQDTDGEYEVTDNYYVILCEKDKKRLGASLLSEAKKVAEASKKTLSFSESTADIDGGFILQCGNIEINCSIGLILAQLRTTLEGDVYKVLFG